MHGLHDDFPVAINIYKYIHSIYSYNIYVPN